MDARRPMVECLELNCLTKKFWKMKKVKKYAIFGMMFTGIVVMTILSCNTEKLANKTQKVEGVEELMEMRKLSFIETVDRIQAEYGSVPSASTVREGAVVETECGIEYDKRLICDDNTKVTGQVTLPIEATGEVYHPNLPPMECGFVIQMTLIFCAGKNSKASFVTFEDFRFIGLLQPVPPGCWQWFQAFVQLPYEEQAEVFKKVLDDYQNAFEMKFMELWLNDPNNNYDPCPEEYPCKWEDPHYVHVKYYKAECTKVCYFFDPDLCDAPILCMKEVACYTDGCCIRERTYCKNAETGEIERCHQAYYVMGECTVPVEGDAYCFFEVEPCDPNRPRCIQEE